MTSLNAWKMAGVVFVLLATTAIAAQAQIFTTLVDFDGTPSGSGPLSPIIQGGDGNFYGTTGNGGVDGWGSVFKTSPQGTLTILQSFTYNDGFLPFGALLLDQDGNFHGTTNEGGFSNACVFGCGTLFQMTPVGVLTTLHHFCSTSNFCSDGALPVGQLVRGYDGNFYGVTHLDGAYLSGTVFRMTPKGALTTLYNFGARTGDGGSPNAGLVQADDGDFYGTTGGGGANRVGGTVFRMTPGGDLSTIYSFCARSACEDGEEPYGVLFQGSDGSFYGTTQFGGSSSACDAGCGTIFKITRDGTLTTLHSFENTDGVFPQTGLIQATDGNFYGGTTGGGGSGCAGFGCGTIFEITPGGIFTTLHSFDGSDGEIFRGLIQATSGILLGTTEGGGIGGCCGTVFSLSTGLRPFVTFVQVAGKVGQTGGILGQGFTGTTSVSLNGTPANFTVVSDTFISATVPAGASTGYVMVTTPSGVLTSNVPFHVIQ